MNENSRIAVLGGGSWATAIMKMLQKNVGQDQAINWYMRNEDSIAYIKKHKRNPRYLSDVEIFTDRVAIFSDISKAIEQSDILIFAIPSAFLQKALEPLKITLKDKIVVSAIKGIVPQVNLIIADYFQQIHGVPENNLAVIAGPCHAEEVALERLSYLTIAAKQLCVAEFIANKLERRFIKTYISDDLYGTEYAAVLKNVFAVAAGIAKGVGYGDNFLAVLISNAIQEIKRFADTVHPITRDISDSAYLGDLMVTAYSTFSRNRQFGMMIGQGYSVKAAQLEMNMIAEGFYATDCIYQINKKYNIFMPISEAVFNILYGGKPPAFEMKLLTDKIR